MPNSHRGGHWFDPSIAHQVLVVSDSRAVPPGDIPVGADKDGAFPAPELPSPASCSPLLEGPPFKRGSRCGPARFRSAGWRDGGVLAEEAGELGAGVRPAGVGVGAVRGTTGPGMPAAVDGPALGQGRARRVLVAG